MNIKIKSDGVWNLVGDSYDKVYIMLQKQFNGDENLFTERLPGHDYLQWELPGDGWHQLSVSDPLMGAEVRRELSLRKQSILTKFGSNQEMAQKILSVPDDSYIYYRADESGNLEIKLTVWGYRYPERVGGGGADGGFSMKDAMEHVTIKVINDGNPVPSKEIRINGFKRTTDKNGVYDAGDLPVGYQFDLDVDNQHQHITVQTGSGEIVIDITLLTTVDVIVTQGDLPLEGTQVTVDYADHHLQLTTDNNGKATVQLPIDPNGSMCTVTVNDLHQQNMLVIPQNTFRFQLEVPEPVVKQEETPEELEKPVELMDDHSEEEQTQPDEVDIDKEEETEEPLIKDPEPEEEMVPDSMEEEEEKEPDVIPDEPKPTEKSSIWMYILEILAVLGLIALVVLTYLICGNMLFG